MLAKAVVLARGEHRASGPGRVRQRLGRDPTTSPALLPLANRPLLEHAFGWLEEAGISQVVLVAEAAIADQLAPEVRDASKWSFHLDLLEQAPFQGLAEIFGDLNGFLDGEPFVLHLADSLPGSALRSLIGDDPCGDQENLMMVQRTNRGLDSKVVELGPRRSRHQLGGGSLGLWGGRSAGVFVLGSAVALAAAAVDTAPRGELESVAQRVIELGGRVRTRDVNEWWRLDRGPDAFLEGNRFALGALKTDYDPALLVDSRVQGRVSIDPSARLESSIVRGPAVIGPGATLRDAYLGPYTSIGRDVIVEGAEVENSIVLSGASIRHLGGRLEASVVGPRARIFRDFRLPKAVRLNVGEDAEVSLA